MITKKAFFKLLEQVKKQILKEILYFLRGSDAKK